MPTVLRLEGLRFFFYSQENGEPPLTSTLRAATRPRSTGAIQSSSPVREDFERGI